VTKLAGRKVLVFKSYKKKGDPVAEGTLLDFAPVGSTDMGLSHQVVIMTANGDVVWHDSDRIRILEG